MKQVYQHPDIQVIEIGQTSTLLAGSTTESTGSAANMNSGSFGARKFDIWDDDEEDEY